MEQDGLPSLSGRVDLTNNGLDELGSPSNEGPFNMPTPLSSVLCFVVAALAGAVGQFLYKSGADQAIGGWTSYVFNVRLIGGVACYIAVMVLFVAAFKRGGSLTVLYPIYASTFVWAAFIAWYAYGTPVKPLNIVGMLCLVLGMYLMGK
jgi:multidrug transporter EmrE-like cation transporter